MKIRTSLIYSIAAGALLCAGSANAQATDPVGFHTLTVFGTDGNPRFSLLAPGLVNAIDFAGATTSITADTITVDGTPFEGLDFGAVAEDPGVAAAYNRYYVEVTEGAEAGAWANVTSNDDSSLTVDRDLSGAGDKIAIRKHVTIGDLFGPANEAGLDEGNAPDQADEVSLFANGESTVYFYDNTAGFEGWTTPDFLAGVNVVIEPQQGVYVQRKVAGDVSFTRSGHVKVGPTKLNINAGGFNIVASPRAVGEDDDSNPVFTLGASNLYDPADPANSVTPGDNPAAADEVLVPQDNGDFIVTFYDTTDQGPGDPNPGEDYGWIDASFADRNATVLDNGKAFLVNRKAPGAAFIWTVPAETIAE